MKNRFSCRNNASFRVMGLLDKKKAALFNLILGIQIKDRVLNESCRQKKLITNRCNMNYNEMNPEERDQLEDLQQERQKRNPLAKNPPIQQPPQKVPSQDGKKEDKKDLKNALKEFQTWLKSLEQQKQNASEPEKQLIKKISTEFKKRFESHLMG